MTYARYNTADNAYGQLSAGITTLSTTAAIINDQNIPATNFIGTLVQFDVDGNVSKFEKVLVAIFSGGNVTMTRAFNGSTAQTFNANDYIFVNVVSEIIADIQAEIAAKQATASKDASGGYVGLTLFKINFKNVLNTFTSFFTNSNTAARTYTFQDRNGIIADDTDIAAARAYADGLVVGLWDDRGNYDASGGSYPLSGGSGTAGAILKGDTWTISVAGTLPTSQVVEVGDIVRALINTPGNTQANWAIQQNNIGYTAENSINKGTTMTGNTASNTVYLSAKAVYDWVVAGFVALTGNQTIAGIKTLSDVPIFTQGARVGTDDARLYMSSANSGYIRGGNAGYIVVSGNSAGSGDKSVYVSSPTNIYLDAPNVYQNNQLFGNPDFYKYTISRTVDGSGNITITYLNYLGATPSATAPVKKQIGDTVRTITSALSFTLNAGVNYMNLGSSEFATKEVDLFPYLAWNGTSVTLCISRMPSGNKGSDFNTASPDNERVGLGMNSTDSVVNIGRFNAILSAGAGYTWSIPATSVIVNRPMNETRELSFTNVCSSDGTLSGIATFSLYKIVGNQLIVKHRVNWSSITGTATYINFSKPIQDNYGVYAFKGIADYYSSAGHKICEVFNDGTTNNYLARYDGSAFVSTSGSFVFNEVSTI